MAASQTDLQTTSETVGSFLSTELRYADRLRVTEQELAGRLSLPREEIRQVMHALAADEHVPVSRDGAAWLVRR